MDGPENDAHGVHRAELIEARHDSSDVASHVVVVSSQSSGIPFALKLRRPGASWSAGVDGFTSTNADDDCSMIRPCVDAAGPPPPPPPTGPCPSSGPLPLNP